MTMAEYYYEKFGFKNVVTGFAIGSKTGGNEADSNQPVIEHLNKEVKPETNFQVDPMNLNGIIQKSQIFIILE